MDELLTEPEIYVRCKEILKKNGWIILGGEPPGGTDHIPRIELRHADNHSRGSKGSEKIDLIAEKKGKLLLLELKKKYSIRDVKKLNQIVQDRLWRISLEKALDSKRAFQKAGVEKIENISHGENVLIKAIGLSEYHYFPSDFILFVVTNTSHKILFGESCKMDLQDLFQST